MPGINSEKSEVCLDWAWPGEAGQSQEMKD